MVNSSHASALNSQRARYRWWYRFPLCAKVATTEVWLTVMGRSFLERKGAKTAHAQWEEERVHLFSLTLHHILYPQSIVFFISPERWSCMCTAEMPGCVVLTPCSGWLLVWGLWRLQLLWAKLFQWRTVPQSCRPLPALLLLGTIIADSHFLCFPITFSTVQIT